jgi:hypothetical protein
MRKTKQKPERWWCIQNGDTLYPFSAGSTQKEAWQNFSWLLRCSLAPTPKWIAAHSRDGYRAVRILVQREKGRGTD